MAASEEPIVRPFVYSLSDGAEIPLEIALRPLLAADRRGIVRIVGGPGSGKTTALEYLARILKGEARCKLVSRPTPGEISASSKTHLVIYSAMAVRPPDEMGTEPDLAIFQLASWGQDQWIEYLLAAHRPSCASVLRRVGACPHFYELGGNPLLATTVLDEFARDESLISTTAALRRFLSENLRPDRVLHDARTACLSFAIGGEGEVILARLEESDAPRRALQAIRHEAVQRILATDRVLEDLRGRRAPKYFVQRFNPDLIESVGQAVRIDAAARDRLVTLFSGRRNQAYQRTIAGLLVASRTGWRPEGKRRFQLAEAHLRGADWAGVSLSKAELRRADLSRADLSAARLDHIRATGARFTGCRLRDALLSHADFFDADFSGADLSFCNATRAMFSRSKLRGATLEGARLMSSSFCGAQLAGASFVRANLTEANLMAAMIENADFSSASLDRANLKMADLRSAVLNGASFQGALLHGANLEYLSIPGGDFELADLTSALLTGSLMPSADLREACLVGAGLAEVEWERADLRGADFTHASFHAGSSRSGLVGSPIASEGSRTGFYTDEYNEQDFRAPEDIRKANLRGADLRGAIVEGTDFYLVDLRDASYDAEQEAHFRRCGAILESRVG